MGQTCQVRNLYHLRTRRGLTLAELARRVQRLEPRAAGRSTLTQYENCQVDASLTTLRALARVLDAPIDEIDRIDQRENRPKEWLELEPVGA